MRSQSRSSSYLNFTIFGLYAVIGNFAVNFAHNLIGSIFRQLFFYPVSCFYNGFCWTNHSRLLMIVTSSASCVLGVFSFYRVIRFQIFCICCHRTHHICLMMTLTRMCLILDPLVRTHFPPFLCGMTILLVVLVVWGLAFSYQYESSPNFTLLYLPCSY